MKLTLALILITIFISSCGTTQKAVHKPDDANQPAKYDESFDPLSLNDDDIIISPDTEPVKTETTVKSKLETEIEENGPAKEVDGYRIQLIATRNIENASLIKQRAEEQFQPLNHEVYLIFEAPFYKIRIADVLRRIEAESIRDTAKELGYDQAFPVRSKVIIREDPL